MFYYDNHFWGMRVAWWFVWGVLLIWIFATPYNVPGQRSKRATPLDILKKRLASGDITDKQYEEKKKFLQD